MKAPEKRQIHILSFFKGEPEIEHTKLACAECTLILKWIAKETGATFIDTKASSLVVMRDEIPEGDDAETVMKKVYNYVDTLGLLSERKMDEQIELLHNKSIEKDLKPGTAFAKYMICYKRVMDKFYTDTKVMI